MNRDETTKAVSYQQSEFAGNPTPITNELRRSNLKRCAIGASAFGGET